MPKTLTNLISTFQNDQQAEYVCNFNYNFIFVPVVIYFQILIANKAIESIKKIFLRMMQISSRLLLSTSSDKILSKSQQQKRKQLSEF